MTHDHSRCAICPSPVSGKSPDVKVIDEALGVLHLECARRALGPHAFHIPSVYYVPMKARMY